MMKKKLVIVDDSIFVYEEMKRLLADSTYDIAGYAKTGEEILEIYANILPDVVTMDIILPE